MNADELVDFWSIQNDTVHPADQGFLGSNFSTDLIPLPWVGNIFNSKMYICFLNPGLSDEDIHIEKDPNIKSALRENLSGKRNYLFLEDSFKDHPGYRWASQTFGDIDRSFSRNICVLQLVPYHSKKGNVARRISTKLPSTKKIKDFLNYNLLKRAKGGEIGLIIARSQKFWLYEECQEAENILIYKNWECLRALQTENTRGGKLIRRILIENKK